MTRLACKLIRMPVALTCLGAALCLQCVPPARASIVYIPPPMRWSDLIDCPLVIVGKYKSKKDGLVVLQVERVLRGDAKVGDELNVSLTKWWSVQTGPVWGENSDPDVKAKAQDKVRICYMSSIIDDDEPLVPFPILDSTQSAVFFFPKKNAALERTGQIQPAALADGWEQAVNKKPMDLQFRLTQKVDSAISAAAEEELKATRDP